MDSLLLRTDLSLLKARLPAAARANFDAWREALEPLTKLKGRELTRELEQVAQRLEVPLKTVRNKMSALRKHGAAALIDRRLAGSDFWKGAEERHLPVADQRLVRQYCLRYDSTEAALRNLRKDWRAGRVQTAREKNPVTGYPHGWSLDNLREYAPTEYELKNIRIGRGAAATLGPMTLTTRANLWVGSHYFIDDVWHNLMVYVGTKRQTARVLELGVMDAFSGCRFQFGCKPRLRNEDGTQQGIKKANMQLILAAALVQHGFSAERGTVLMGELGTAKVYDETAKLLYDETGGKIIRREGGITGAEQAVLGWWEGKGGGNPRFKSPLEVFHRSMQTEFSMLPGQTGRSVVARPEALDGMLDYMDALATWAVKQPPERIALLRLPILEFHSEFLPLAHELHHAVNDRRVHNLEGWAAAGNYTSDFRLVPGSEEWLTQEQFLALPEISQRMLAEAVRAQPGHYDRKRKLSPYEAHCKGRGELTRIRPHVVCTMLSPFFTREAERVDGAYFVFEDREIAPERLWYEARIKTPEGHWQELRDGERYNVLVNPFAPGELYVMNAKNAYLGVAPAAQRTPREDLEAIRRANGHQAERTVARLSRVRADLQPEAAEIETMRTHNAEVMSGAPITAEEHETVTRQKARRISLEKLQTGLAQAAADMAGEEHESI